MIAAYGDEDKVNVMNAAWGMICNTDRIALFIDEDHKTTQNILKKSAASICALSAILTVKAFLLRMFCVVL